MEQQKKEEQLLLKRRRAALGRWQLLLRSMATRLRLKNTYEEEVEEEDGGNKGYLEAAENLAAQGGAPCDKEDTHPFEGNKHMRQPRDVSHVHEFKEVCGSGCDGDKSIYKVCHCGFKLEMEEI